MFMNSTDILTIGLGYNFLKIVKSVTSLFYSFWIFVAIVLSFTLSLSFYWVCDFKIPFTLF